MGKHSTYLLNDKWLLHVIEPKRESKDLSSVKSEPRDRLFGWPCLIGGEVDPHGGRGREKF